MGRGFIAGQFDPRNAADHIGAKCHGLVHQFRCARLAHDAVLRKGHDLQVDNAAEFVAHAEQRLDAFEPRLGVHVGEGTDVQIAVQRCERNRAAGVFHDPPFGVFLFDLAGELDAGQRLAHAFALIGAERLLLHHRQSPDLAQMQMRIDETLRHQIAAGVDFGCGSAIETRRNGGDATVLDADVGIPIGGATQASMADRDVERLSIHLSRARRRQSLTGAGDGEDRGVRHTLQIPRR